jgi:hypothetical protein
LVEHFARQPWSNGRVGSFGASYDGETQNAGAVLQPKGLATMVPVAAISGLYDVAYFDGVPYVAAGAGSAVIYAVDNQIPAQHPERVIEVAHRMGIRSPLRPYCCCVCGGLGTPRLGCWASSPDGASAKQTTSTEVGRQIRMAILRSC